MAHLGSRRVLPRAVLGRALPAARPLGTLSSPPRVRDSTAQRAPRRLGNAWPEARGCAGRAVPAELLKIESLFEQRGATRYDGFTTQEEHARVTAHVAQQEGADRDTVVAAFLHDIGHLLLDEHAGRADFLQDDKCHERVGYVFLRSRFGAAVAEPVRLHVGAKRYLCSVDADYYDGLSEASKQSLALQGGPLSAAEAEEWLRQPYAAEAARLRRWEDEGKRRWMRGEFSEAQLPSRAELLDATAEVLRAE